jgi:heptaprenyl diphosphate synthase
LKSTRKLTRLAMFISAALVLHVVEMMMPIPFPVPGIKLGLANIVTLTALMFFSFKDVFIIVLLRCLLGSIFGGGVSSFLFSLSGGILSAIVMWIIYSKFSKYFSLIGVSTAGSVAHNIGQLFMAGLIIADPRIYVYLPLLMISSIVTGVFIGIVCNYARKLIINNISKLGLSLKSDN